MHGEEAVIQTAGDRLGLEHLQIGTLTNKNLLDKLCQRIHHVLIERESTMVDLNIRSQSLEEFQEASE